ncbi:vitamin B12 import ATP-binding protein BtuD [Streptosporangium roseum]|uniref:Daunorubicin resistance ABC transporter ATPase subunit n=1 Tax=Streptosporangium roseum (strain ATCC 12428 / DSM 43021 / JCM 3005 / KCTC 9067 / NCIMB 10171 / NRRL 2505 / NI 9100) TaxID=479432 RepID=D2AZW2_STRRD|nr:daunorubicin resistance ABC transporter ATPase subunit [Streptosporangium roseum DSM 43021]
MGISSFRGPAIEAENLSRSYRLRSGWLRPQTKVIEAVKDVSFSIEQGELFGLLGPNGAGKTTTIKMLNTLLLPSGGTARVLGHDVAKDPVAVRQRIGYVFGGDKGLYDRLSALDNLRYFAELYGVEPAGQGARIQELLELVGLSGRERERVEGYSRGMRQRLHIARGLLHMPEVLFLDEPSIGVDPVAARALREMIQGLSARGITVLLTTHYMAEADQLCDRIAVIAGGRIRVVDTPDALKASVAAETVIEVEVVGATGGHTAALRALPGLREMDVEEGEGQVSVLTMRAKLGVDLYSAALSILSDVHIVRVSGRESSLEDAYVAIVGRG